MSTGSRPESPPVALDPSHGIALVTDGSANWKDGSGGYAWIALDAFDGIARGSGHRAQVTNNQMELLAPTAGLLELEADLGACEVLVYSDSEYVVLGAGDPTRKRRKNHQYWKDLNAAMDRHTSVAFFHVKGHQGHLWNEMADEMAGIARREGAR